MKPGEDKLALAQKHLSKVQAAWAEPDWSDLAIYGLYTLENAVLAAAEHFGIPWKPTHPSQVAVARQLHEKHGLTDVRDLLKDLNDMRINEAYGQIRPTGQYDAQDVASLLEEFVEEVGATF